MNSQRTQNNTVSLLCHIYIPAFVISAIITKWPSIVWLTSVWSQDCVCVCVCIFVSNCSVTHLRVLLCNCCGSISVCISCDLRAVLQLIILIDLFIGSVLQRSALNASGRVTIATCCIRDTHTYCTPVPKHTHYLIICS